jgi:hypothetical protein
MEHHGFGDLQLKAIGREAGVRQGLGDAIDEIIVLELHWRQIDRDLQSVRP